MSLHDFRRIALAHDLLVQSSRKRPDTAEWTGTESQAAEPEPERIPAETAAQESDG